MFPSTTFQLFVHRYVLAMLAVLAVLGMSVTFAHGADDYKIRANDTIEVKVFQEDDLSLKTRVSKEGLVILPLVGPIRIAGLSPNIAAQRIKTAYADGYLVNPQVNVTVADIARRNFTVLGEVSKPGVYQIPDYEFITLVQAIGMAGGFTNKANERKVTIKRKVQGKDVTRTFNARDMAKLSQSRQIAVVDGDVISIAESIF
ncbi:MAG: protein involved in polysaccharide export with SLBB domain [Verrucomicrobiales bacterium]|jgi:protein involved in polysaccharide export with SLBB domain